jgi:hypothetical protein
VENSFKNVVDQSKTLLILLPLSPTFDQVAAGLALYLGLRESKEIQIYSPSPMTVEFNRLIAVNKITQEMGNKNLIIRFVDYRANDIERVSYDIENGQFRLTVIPKQKISPPTKDQIELNYSGVSADTILIVGGATEEHFPAITSKDLVGADIVHIGTQDISMSSNKSYISFSRPASSVSEVVASLIKESGISLDQDIASNLLMGIEEASNNFTTPAVTAETFATISELMKAGGERLSVQKPAVSTNYPPGAIPQASWANQTIPQPQPQQASDSNMPQPPKVQNQVQDQEVEDEEPPKDWLSPKIYKGTSIS